MARINRALRINRVPATEARILSALDREGLLGKQILVVGTNALYAYECMTGVLVAGELLATEDMDLLWDHRPRLSLVVNDVESRGILGILREVDHTFQPAGPRSFRAENDDRYLVDLIRPQESDFRVNAPEKIWQSEEELYAVGIEGLQWLVNTPKVEETVIGSNGMPLLFFDRPRCALLDLPEILFWVLPGQAAEAQYHPHRFVDCAGQAFEVRQGSVLGIAIASKSGG
jgi:hypothetical protein